MCTFWHPLPKDLKVFHEPSVKESDSVSTTLETNQLCFSDKGSKMLDQCLGWSVLVIAELKRDLRSVFYFSTAMENRTFITLLTLWPVLEDCNIWDLCNCAYSWYLAAGRLSRKCRALEKHATRGLSPCSQAGKKSKSYPTGSHREIRFGNSLLSIYLSLFPPQARPQCAEGSAPI